MLSAWTASHSLGCRKGGAVAILYAARHPERVSQLILYGAYARGRRRRGQPAQEHEAALLADAIRVGWGGANPAFRRLFTTLLLPDGSQEQMAEFDQLQRISTSPENAVRYRDVFDDIDVTDAATSVRTPTLIVHVRDDGMVPFDEGRLIATLIPDAIFVPLEGRNHMLLEDEPSWPRFVQAVRAFLGPSPVRTSASPNERGLEQAEPSGAGRPQSRSGGIDQRRDRGRAVPQCSDGRAPRVGHLRETRAHRPQAARAAAAAKGSLLERDAAPDPELYRR